MSLTLGLVAGLILLLPGVTALTIWNFLGSRQGAKRPEVQLTSVNALFIAIIIALAMHVVGFALSTLALGTAVELGGRMPHWWPAITAPDNPYNVIVGLMAGTGHASAGSLEAFLVLIAMESLFVGRLVASDGFDLALEGADTRAQGWVFQHIVRPARYGYKPIGYVLTLPVQGEYGIGYEGVIADVRQGDNGEVKAISLAEPQRFVYRLMPSTDDQPRRRPQLVMEDREWIGGIVALDGSVIRNVVVHNVSAAALAGIAAEASGLAPKP